MTTSDTAGDLFFYRFGGRPSAGVVARGDFVDEVESVIAEVTLLLNTRSSLSASEIGSERRTVVDYGLADFVHFSPLSRQDSQKLANLMFKTIVAYEPRFLVDSVTVDTPRPYRDKVCAIVSGRVCKRDKSLVTVRFPVQVTVATQAK